MPESNIHTERLILRPAGLEDADFVLKLYNEPDFIKNIGDRNIRTLEDAENYIKLKFLPQYEKLGFGNYVMIRKCDSEKIGATGVFVREGFEVPDIGFSLLRDYQAQGYAYEAAKCIKNLVQTQFGLRKISAITGEDNLASQKLIEKLGLKFIKIVPFPETNEFLRYYEN